MSTAALNSLQIYAPDAASLDKALWTTVYSRMKEKLTREAVEDFRIDFEDGYGNRPTEEEDGHAVAIARELAKRYKEKTLPPFIGIRIKPFNDENVKRSVRTLDLFLTTLLDETG